MSRTIRQSTVASPDLPASRRTGLWSKWQGSKWWWSKWWWSKWWWSKWWVSPAVFWLVALAGSGALDAMQSVVGPRRSLVQLTQFGPAIGVVTVLLIWRGAARPVTRLKLGQWPGTAARSGLAVLAVTSSLVLSAGAAMMLGWSTPVQGPQHWGAPIGALVVAQLLGSAAEEVGWRCLLQPTLENRWGTLRASIVVGLLWGAWHVPMMVRSWQVATCFMVATIAMSITMGELVRGPGCSPLVVATVFHTATNLGMLALSDPQRSEAGSLLTLAIGASIIAALSLAARRVPGGGPAVTR